MTFLLALPAVPRPAAAMVPGLFAAMAPVIMTGLARTRHGEPAGRERRVRSGDLVRLRGGRGHQEGGGPGGLSPKDDGASIALAAFAEEPGKPIPLAVVALGAPGRARRSAAADWALLGYAAGLGFTVAEDICPPPSADGPAGGPPGRVRALLLPEPVDAGQLRGLGGAVAVGHRVRTMIVAVAVGLGIALWRVGTVRAGAPFGAARRVTALVPPVLAMAQVSADHAGWNACGSALGWMDNDAEGIPWWVRPLWLVGGRGALAVPVSVALLGCCLLVDDYRRGGARERGLPLPEARRCACRC